MQFQFPGYFGNTVPYGHDSGGNENSALRGSPRLFRVVIRSVETGSVKTRCYPNFLMCL